MRGIELNFLKKGAEFGGIFEEQNEGKNSLSIHNQDVALSAKSFRVLITRCIEESLTRRYGVTPEIQISEVRFRLTPALARCADRKAHR
jgi:hypothetical protein